MVTVYDLFDQIRPLMGLVEQPKAVTSEVMGVEYLKLVQTGGLSEVCCDYGLGFLCVSISTVSPEDGNFCTRVFFHTLDDGDYGAWGKPFSAFEDAQANTKRVAEVFRDMVALPSPEDLNALLRPLGLYAGRE